ncbi:hypothetical protein, conserved [Eimeria tenella]|uniref:Uncharacterized protein n=1 Tax=Eimeria tenella TaxID=5802 RepID=U6L3N2_EIMTE|nr:hypothetical protein, conserved [Eimeria tenella]CDJ44977.1 hypothetical protein, conserved [Eimeria tenella]|eukprot:XP_013235724.1 hypothetical protein, conserved [Eimeria tenella]
MYGGGIEEGFSLDTASEFGGWSSRDLSQSQTGPFLQPQAASSPFRGPYGGAQGGPYGGPHGGPQGGPQGGPHGVAHAPAAATAAYKTTNYRALEQQLKLRMQNAQSALKRAELTPRSPHVAAALATALSDADVTLQQLSIEARGSPSGQALAAELAAYGDALARLRQQSEEWTSRAVAGETPRQQLEPEELAEVSSRLILESNSSALQTEDIGLHIMQQLRTQRDAIIKTNRLAEGTGAEGARGRQAIVKMIRDHWLNRLLLTGTILLLALCILLVLLHKARLFRFFV